MKALARSWPRGRIEGLELILAVVSLLATGYYAVNYAFVAPYPGLDYDGRWFVLRFDDNCRGDPACAANQAGLQIDDRLVRIGNLTFEEYQRNYFVVPFAGYRPGDRVPISFVRQGSEYQTDWPMGRPHVGTRLVRLASLLFFLPFWIAGSVVLLFLRPRDQRWLLLVAANYLTALWIATGQTSTAHVAASPLIAVMASLWMVPVYLHLHLRLPAPLAPRLSRYLLPTLYAAAGLVTALLAWQRPLNYIMYVSVLLAISGSLALLLFRVMRRDTASDRLVTRLMLIGVGLGFGPGLVLWLLPRMVGLTETNPMLVALTTVALPLWPFFYVYALYKHRLGNLEFRANRWLSLYSFVLVFSTALAVTFLAFSHWLSLTAREMSLVLVIVTAFLVLALWLQGPFLSGLDRLAYGTRHKPGTIIATFANEIPRALDREALVRLLTHDVLPALLIRQSALYILSESETSVVYADGVGTNEASAAADIGGEIQRLARLPRRYLLPETATAASASFGWVHLAIPIGIEGKCTALWLLGKRDPDDYYPQPDIELLSTLGNQIGVALETSRLIASLQRRAAELETAYRDLQKLDQLKDEFVQNVSHELRTPLTFLRGYADLLSEEILGPLTGQQRDALATMTDRTEGIIRLVNDIISLQNRSAEQASCEPVNLAALARSCLDAAELTARQHASGPCPYVFAMEAGENVPQVMGDRRRLAQVIDNLVNNAIKFSPDGGTIGVRVVEGRYAFGASGESNGKAASLETAEPKRDQPAVLLTVRDEGIGIPEGELGRIWQRFYQVDGSSRRRFGGMGLGLAIVHDIVASHCGEIWVESTPGRGSAFHIALPAARV